jgi:ATP-dependent 26S proteasome regulatory subunit
MSETPVADATTKSDSSCVLLWHASALPFVIQSSVFNRATSILASSFFIGSFSYRGVVFRALPALNTSCESWTCTLDPCIVGNIPAEFDCQPAQPALHGRVSELSVTAVSVASRSFPSSRALQSSGQCFRCLQTSLKRSLRRQWLGMPVHLGAYLHAAVALEVVLFRIDDFKIDVDVDLSQGAPASAAIVEHCTNFNVNLDRLGSMNFEPETVSPLPFVHRETFTELWGSIQQALDPTTHSGHIISLCGAHGSGKSTLCQQISSSASFYVEIISLACYVSPPCASFAYGWTPHVGLRSFNSVVSIVLSRSPSVLVIDDFFLFDSSSPSASLMLNTIKELSGQRVCVILCCRESARFPPDIRSPTKLLRVIDIGALTVQQRHDIFCERVRGLGCSFDDSVDWKDLMKYCSGFTIGDIRRLVASCVTQGSRSCEGHMFHKAIRGSSSLASSDIPVEFPTDTLEGLAGFCDIRERLKQLVVSPVVSPTQYRAMGMNLPKGVLLCGSRGSGKTTLVRAAAGSAGAALITVTPSLLYRRYLGESEAAVKSIYAAARSRTPCVVFLDDTDALLTSRNSDASDGVGERVLAALLTEIDGLDALNNDLIFTIGATSRIDAIDPALARPGRLEQCLHVHLPTFDDRWQILNSILSRMHIQSCVDVRSLTRLTEGMALESMVSLCHRAAYLCMERGTNDGISQENFVAARDSMTSEINS